MNVVFHLLLVLAPCLALNKGEFDPEYGTYIGTLKTLHHDVTGEVFAVDDVTIYIRGFSYDGEAPDAYFYGGNRTPFPSNRGFIIPNERKRTSPLGRYRNRNLLLKLPKGKNGDQKTIKDMKWISIWCKKYAIDFGHVMVPKDLDIPSSESVGRLGRSNYLEAEDVIMADSETIILKDFSYDGTFPDAIFMVGENGNSDNHFQVSDERGSFSPLRRYSRRTMSLKLPKSSRGAHIQYFSVWSPSAGVIDRVNFPHDMRVPPSIEKRF